MDEPLGAPARPVHVALLSVWQSLPGTDPLPVMMAKSADRHPGGTREANIFMMGSPRKKDSPRLPLSMFPTQVPYCTIKGLSSPRSCRTSAFCASVNLLISSTPKYAPRGSPGRTRMMVKINMCKRRSDNVPRRRLDSLIVAVENRTACHLPIESIETLMEGDYGCTSWTCIFAYAGRAWWSG